MATIYMYHAVGKNAELAGADPHYAVSHSELRKQLAIITPGAPLAEQLRRNGKIESHSIGFDDGHISNYKAALETLQVCDVRAEFYINTANVGKKNFMDWGQLQELANVGMSIQSHGHEHRYFSDMTPKEIDEHLGRSKSMIEDKIGQQVSIFAPPGGRYDKRVTASAKNLGYRAMAISRPGPVSRRQEFHLPRFAVLSSTTLSEITQWKSRMSKASLKQVIKYKSTGLLKSCLGNQRYEVLRQRILGESNLVEQRR